MAINLQSLPLNTNIMVPILSSFTVVIIIVILSKLHLKKTRNLLPSPPALPIIGNLHQLGPYLHRSFHSLSKNYGPILLLYLGSIPAIVISSAELAEQVMKTQDLTFSTRPPSSIANRLFYNCRDIAFASYGEHWRQMKRICVVHLLSVKMVQSFRSVIDEEASLLLSSIKEASPSPVNLSKMIMVLTNDIICRVALGRKYSLDDGFREMLKEASLLLGSFPMKDYIPRLSWVDKLSGLNARVRKNFEMVDGFLERVLEDHAVRREEDVDGGRGHHGEFVDFVDVLLSQNKNDGTSGGFRLDKDSIKALIWEMFAAGTDTIYITIEWILAELITHPSVMSKAQEEVRRVLGSSQSVTEEALNKMDYLKAVIREALRMHPPIPTLVPREAMNVTELEGYVIPKGTRVFINVWTISRDPMYWEKPEEFWPERFLNIKSADFKGQNFEFTPFGSGRRRCPGINFSTLTIECVLAKLLLAFDWEVPNDNKNEVHDMSEAFGINTQKKYNLLLKAKPYSFPSAK
ncbi:hypothetical protein IEQ34_021494 [Dendrobium chrysotoxum]|uniref:Cytochrome P450 n=1 Tax=Dendrobium chrysotoxum TaxID=161865 RepID=A0AAV7G4X7_DENCH|nr:hypothetical protein IEQ34_021494 [Dendrobium chrysotoxum]